MIKLQNISYNYNGSTALEDISFEVKEGEKVLLMGVNGSGKSTLLKLLGALIFPQQGVYTFKDEMISKKKLKQNVFNAYFRSKVVMLFQKPDVMLFNPTVYDELAFGIRQLQVENIDDKVSEWAERLNITHLLDKQPFNLSGGEKKKVALVSLLIIDPQVLILDEPFSYLDPQTTEWMIDFLSGLDKTLILSLHNFKIASLFSHRLLVLSKNHHLIYNGEFEGFFSSTEKLKDAHMFSKHNTL